MTETAPASPATRSYPQQFFAPSPGACQIVLIRHGQSTPFVEGSPFPLVDGQGDPPLSPLGVYQAQRVAERLAQEPLTAMYASTLQRTTQTLEPLAAMLGLTPTIMADLREVYLGVGEGGRFRQMAATEHPQAVAMRTQREWGAIEGAETNAQLMARTSKAIMTIAARHPDELVAVCCHGGVIGSLLGFAAGVNPFTFAGSRNGALSHLVVNASAGEEPWVIRSFNDASHAGPLTADTEPPT